VQIGIVGLGRMGGNMARRLARRKVNVVGFDRTAAKHAQFRDEAGIVPTDSLEVLVAQLKAPRVVWLMLPAGAASQTTLQALAARLSAGDVVVDGANAHYKDSIRHAAELAKHGIEFVDAGVSGGIWGLDNGYGLMLGGSAAAIERVKPFLQHLAPAPDKGWLHCGPVGAGHFVKMVHNGIEYGMMQAYAEGFAVMREKKELALDLGAIAECWRYGTVIRSWLLDLTAPLLSDDKKLVDAAPVVADSGEGRWTALEAIELGVPAPVMSLALMMRWASQGRSDFAARLLAGMRNAFGGHEIAKKKPASA
jgi:6-phosphogluconate dehydrogenase